MKTRFRWMRFGVLSLLIAFVTSSVSCMTTYDAYGHPVATVDPAVALAGVAAAGLVGYAAADRHHYRTYDRGYYRPYPCD